MNGREEVEEEVVDSQSEEERIEFPGDENVEVYELTMDNKKRVAKDLEKTLEENPLETECMVCVKKLTPANHLSCAKCQKVYCKHCLNRILKA